MLYKKIVQMCKERNMSIHALEAACGLGNGTVKCWEKANPRVDLLKKVCDFFGITIDELMKED